MYKATNSFNVAVICVMTLKSPYVNETTTLLNLTANFYAVSTNHEGVIFNNTYVWTISFVSSQMVQNQAAEHREVE